MFINLSNHPSTTWGDKQRTEALKYGEITDIAFPPIDPEATAEDIHTLAAEYFEKIQAYENPTVMIMGEFSFCFALITLCKQAGIRTVCTTTVRKSVDNRKPDGTVEKTSVFEFVQYREY